MAMWYVRARNLANALCNNKNIFSKTNPNQHSSKKYKIANFYLCLSMSSSSKNILIALLIFIVSVLSIVLLSKTLFTKKDNSTVDSTIVIQKIQKVMKLVTVEGNYAELLRYNDFEYVDFPGFRKDAILKVKAKVSVGYNLENMKISTDEKMKIIKIQQMPKPEIVSIDTDISFENLSTGWFTSFSEAELTKLNNIAKQKIKEKALSTELIRQAEEQKNDVFDLLFYMAKQNGYTIQVEGVTLQALSQSN